jgi:hypothetical protein
MKPSREIALWLYTRLLRCYPARFRADYGDEMRQVFADAVGEAGDGLAVLGILAGELRDLPMSAAREHLREREQAAAFATGGVMNIAMARPMRTLNISAWSALGVCAVYGLLVVLPFFALGLHLEPANAVRGGMFDPKGYAFYSSDQTYPNPLLILTILVMLVTPIWTVIWGSVAALTLGKYWRLLRGNQRFLGGLALLASVSLIAFVFSPFGRLVMTWLID